VSVLLERLAGGHHPVYIATRLFDPGGRYIGARIEQECRRELRSAIAELGLAIPEVTTYLPFRDSNESVDTAPDETFVRSIFRIDCERLLGATALVAPLYDLSHDSGVGFEVGFAAASRLPVVSLPLNFCRFRVGADILPFDPILVLMSSVIVAARAHQLSPEEKTAEGYLGRIEEDIGGLATRAGRALRSILSSEQFVRPLPLQSIDHGRVHLEFGGGHFEFQELLADAAASVLEAAGWTVSISRRYRCASSASGAMVDLQMAATAEVAVTLGDGDDVSAEVAAVQGCRFALGRPTVMYFSGAKSLYTGPGYDTARNLMVSESAATLVRSIAELPGGVESAAACWGGAST